MKKLLLALFLIAFSGIAFAQTKLQKRYTITPTNVLVERADFNMQNDFKIYQDNISDDTLILKWQLISKSLVNGWDYSTCAFGICYTGIPDSLCTMNPLPPHETAFLSLLIDPKDHKGTGKATYYVYDSQNPSVRDTISFIISTDMNSISDHALANAWSLYPNPASESISIKIDHNGSPGSSIRISNIVGQTVYTASVRMGVTEVPVNTLSPGIYFVRYDSGDSGFSIKKLEIIK